MAKKLSPFHRLLKSEMPINTTAELKDTFDSVNKALSDGSKLALKQTTLGQQLVLLTDASFRSTGYLLIIADNPDHKKQSKRKTYALVAFGPKISPQRNLKCPTNQKKFCQNMVVVEFAHILWETTKPIIIPTANKTATRFSQLKATPTRTFWKARRNHHENSCLQRKLILSQHGAIDQRMGDVLWAMH